MPIKAAYPLTPFFDLVINGEPAPKKLLATITNITVKEALMSANTITITFGSSDIAVAGGTNERLVDDKRFVIGSRVSLVLGWVGGQKRVYSNYVYTKNSVVFGSGGIPTVTNEAYNFTYFMNKSNTNADDWPKEGTTDKTVRGLVMYILSLNLVSGSIEGNYKEIFDTPIKDKQYKPAGTTNMQWLIGVARTYGFVFYPDPDGDMKIVCTAPGPAAMGLSYDYRFGEYNLMSFTVTADARDTAALIEAMKMDPYTRETDTGQSETTNDDGLGDTVAKGVVKGEGNVGYYVGGDTAGAANTGAATVPTDNEASGTELPATTGPQNPSANPEGGSYEFDSSFTPRQAADTTGDPAISPQKTTDQGAASTGFDVVSGTLEIAGGDPDVRVGMRISLWGLGTRYSGHYWAVGTQHTIDSNGGYFTRVDVLRNALDSSTNDTETSMGDLYPDTPVVGDKEADGVVYDVKGDPVVP